MADEMFVAVESPKSLIDFVEDSLNSLDLRPEDAGTAELAREYARALVADPKSLRLLGHRLLNVLDALGATPKARAEAPRPADTPVGTKLAKLRGIA